MNSAVLIYPFIFLSSSLFFSFSGFLPSKKTVYLRYLFVAISIFIPVVFAGIRDLSIGTDTSGYVLKLFISARNCGDLAEFLQLNMNQYEVGYLFITYCMAKISSNIHWLLFVNQLLIISPIVFGIARAYEGENLFLPYLIYLFLFYCESLNMVRQSIALSFVFLGLVFLLNKNKLLYFVLIVAALLFHTSAIIGIVFFLISIICSNPDRDISDLRGSSLKEIIAKVVIIVLPLAAAVLFVPIADFLLASGFLSDKYSIYLIDNGSSPLVLLNVYIVAALLVFISRKDIDNGPIIYYSLFYYVVLFSLSSLSSYFWRLSDVFLYPLVLIFDHRSDACPKRSIFESGYLDQRACYVICKVFVTTLSIALWYIQIVIWGNHDVYPYVFSLL